MPLHKLEHFDQNYRDTFGKDDLKALDLYTEGGEIGSVADVLVDDDGHFRYLIIDISLDFVSKKILLPIGLCRISYPERRVYVDGLSRQQIEGLPDCKEDAIVNNDYEEKVRSVFRSPTSGVTYDRNTYNYQEDPYLYGLNEQSHQTFKLYEERLIANKHRIKTGEVTVGKHIETETVHLTVPIQKERVMIERVVQTEAGKVVDANQLNFQEGEVVRIEVYDERPEIHKKEAFVREEVRVKKVVEQDTVKAQDTIRREELDVDTAGDLDVKENAIATHEVI